ncbi:MAG: phosphotransferase [Phycisphaerales bacterium]|nr:phosphotransferase [Phycisphaerales bacterium]
MHTHCQSLSSVRLADIVAAAYGLKITAISRVRKGTQTRNWRLDTDQGEIFLKEYIRGESADEIQSTLTIGERSRIGGIPVPRVIPTVDGKLFFKSDQHTLAAFEFVHGTSPVGSLNKKQMARAGEILGRMHGILARCVPDFPDEAPAWLKMNPNRKLAEIDSLLEVIRTKGRDDPFAGLAEQTLVARKAMLPKLPELLAGSSELRTQVIHGDFSTPNLFYHGDDLTAVIDFGPAAPFLTAHEIGRMAFTVENFDTPEWLEKALCFIEAYCANKPDAAADVRMSARMWLVQLTKSLYGVEQHFLAPLEFQKEVDLYWLARCRAAQELFLRLDEVENMLSQKR